MRVRAAIEVYALYYTHILYKTVEELNIFLLVSELQHWDYFHLSGTCNIYSLYCLQATDWKSGKKKKSTVWQLP